MHKIKIDSLNKELDDFYDKINFTDYENGCVKNNVSVEGLIKEIERVNIHPIGLKNIFQNFNSVDDTVSFFACGRGCFQPIRLKSDNLKKLRLIKNKNEANSNDKKSLSNQFMNKINKLRKNYGDENYIFNKSSAFEINTKLTIKTGDHYYYSDEPFDWASEYKLGQISKLKDLKSSFADRCKITKNAVLINILNETKFRQMDKSFSFKLILINKDGLFQSIFGNLLTGHDDTIDDDDKDVIKTIIDSKSIDLKINRSYKVERITILDHPKFKSSNWDFDVINDYSSDFMFSSKIATDLALSSKASCSFNKCDLRFKIKQVLKIEENSLKCFKLLQECISTIIKFNRPRELLLKCKRNQFKHFREKDITSYQAGSVDDYGVLFNVTNCVEYYLDNKNKTNIDDSELRLKRGAPFTSLSLTFLLTEILKCRDFDLKLNEIVDNSWDLGQWLSRVASSCI